MPKWTTKEGAKSGLVKSLERQDRHLILALPLDQGGKGLGKKTCLAGGGLRGQRNEAVGVILILFFFGL